ncbi:PREDICTED: uncharacterized protein LOC108363415 [Rhagoletis zephyria]|uniref:uncharacterized protein LOC108363415 n=1 Tax=Rhagoletis zephyria TaxID=28612 RepID=UPI0008117A0B|nr:PREDICTED: uncharacterized protein LOC108363415 [Rhagoletis zephyria]
MESALESFYYESTTEPMADAAAKDWRKWLALGESLDFGQRCSLMWIWPTEDELQKLGSVLKVNKIVHILSVGCGSGLLEWIIKECLGISVSGIEIDRAWWESKYAIKSFINLNYIEDLSNKENIQGDYLQKCCNLQSWNFALMFCYFNNHSAFLNYLNMYKGNSLLIIGPKVGMGVFTDPLPLEPQLPEGLNWTLKSTLNIGRRDVIAFYTKEI